jgi:hypothetical protein
VIGVTVLIGLLVAADRVGNVIAEHTVARTVQESQNLAYRPDVDIAGFPFLTQLAAGKFAKVTLRDHDVTTGKGRRALRLSAVTVVLRDVRVARDFTSATAGRTTASALVSYADLSSALGVAVTYAGNGLVRAKASAPVLGRTVRGTVTARPVVRSGALGFGSTHVSAGGVRLPSSAAQALADVFGAPLSFAGLPYGLSVQSVAASGDGLDLVLAGRNLTFLR